MAKNIFKVAGLAYPRDPFPLATFLRRGLWDSETVNLHGVSREHNYRTSCVRLSNGISVYSRNKTDGQTLDSRPRTSAEVREG